MQLVQATIRLSLDFNRKRADVIPVIQYDQEAYDLRIRVYMQDGSEFNYLSAARAELILRHESGYAVVRACNVDEYGAYYTMVAEEILICVVLVQMIRF